MSNHSDGEPDTKLMAERYALIAERRNTYLKFAALFLIGGGVGLTIPRNLYARNQRNLYRRFLRGSVLDLSPKLLDTSIVDLFEQTNTVKVSFAVQRRVTSERHYQDSMDLCTTEEERKALTRDMTLCFLKNNDAHWINSSITFDTVLRDDIHSKFDSVLIHNELWHTDEAHVHDLVTTAISALKPGAHLVVLDVAVPAALRNLFRKVHVKAESEIFLTHDFNALIVDATKGDAQLVEYKTSFFGLCHSVVLRRNGGESISTS